ncbi:MAG: protease modulator HflC [Alphaproteobacteria bacterium]|nr:MAG: protease modulator HflC [Alphaproteobacteria bacterium]
MKRSSLIGIVVAVALGITLFASVYVVDEREQVLVLQFGQVVAKRQEPGLAFKLPFIQNVVRYEDRILSLDTNPLEITPLDNRRLVVDAFARWRITDPEAFRRAVGSERAARTRLDSILRAAMRQELGSVTSNTLLSADRAQLMTKIRDIARASSSDLGVEIVDVRIKRADLPTQNLEATFGRMQAERQRMAADERARGKEAAQIIRAQADRTAVETVSAAHKKAEIIRGEADAKRNAIYAAAYGLDPEFFAFYRSLAAYERALKGKNSSLVITPDSDFFEYLKTDRPHGLPETAPQASVTETPAPPRAAEATDATPAEEPATAPAEGTPAPAPAEEAPAPAVQE